MHDDDKGHLRVGFIGLGLMGHGMAFNILAKGFPLTVLAHRNRAPVDDLVARGAREAATGAELARDSDVVILCVTGSPQVEEALTREHGVLEGLREGAVVIDASTGDPDVTVRLAALVEARGGRMLDVPVNRTPNEAREGRLHALAGGDAEVLARVRPVIDAYCEILHHLGGLGAGQKAKLVHNFIVHGNAVVLAEAFTTAAKIGLDLRAFADLCTLSGAHSRMFDRMVPYLLEGDDTRQRFALRNAAKDVRYYAKLAEGAQVLSPAAAATYQTLLLATHRGHGDRLMPHLFDVLGDINGVRVKAD